MLERMRENLDNIRIEIFTARGEFKIFQFDDIFLVDSNERTLEKA